MWKRITANVVLFLSILFLPWYLSLIFAFLFLFVFHFFIEFIVFAFIIDMLFGIGGVPMFGLYAIGIFVVVLFFKTKLRFYKN